MSPQPPLVDCLQDSYGDWLCNGSNIDVVRLLEQKLNFRAEWLVLASSHTTTSGQLSSAPSGADNGAGDTAHTNGSDQLGALLGLVKAGRAWLSANGFARTSQRDLMDLLFSEPFDSFKVHLLLSKSVRDHDHIFVKPFSGQAWAAILSSALLVVPVFYLINTTSSYYLLEADTPLESISLLACLKHLIGKAIRKRQPTSSLLAGSSANSSFELEVQQVIDSGDPVLSLNLGTKWQELHLKREARRNWALERRRARRLVRNRTRTGFWRASYVLWYVLASLSNQGGETEDLPSANSTRILIAFWWLYIIVVGAIHAGILTAILTFPRQNDFIQTLDDFLALSSGERQYEDEALRLFVDKNSELAQLLSSPDNLHKSPLGALVRRQQVHRVDFQRHRQRLLDQVQRGQGAYIEERSAINLIISQEYFDHKPFQCQFKASKYPLDSVPMSLALSNRLSPVCLRQINKLLARIRQSGLPIKWRRRFEPAGNDCLETVVINAGDVAPIRLKQVVLAHWVLGAGLVGGLLALVLEIVWLLTADSLDSSSLFSSSSSSSCSSSLSCSFGDTSSDSSGSSDHYEPRMQLGHKTALQRQRGVLRSAPIRSLHRRIGKLPKPPGIPGEQPRSRAEFRRRRRAERAAKRRGRRLQRTVDLWRRLREGKIYSSALVRVSSARRASLAWLSQRARVGPGAGATPSQPAPKQRASQRRQAPLRPANNKVKPVQLN